MGGFEIILWCSAIPLAWVLVMRDGFGRAGRKPNLRDIANLIGDAFGSKKGIRDVLDNGMDERTLSSADIRSASREST